MKEKERNIDEDGYGDKDSIEPNEKNTYKNDLPSDANSERLEDSDKLKNNSKI